MSESVPTSNASFAHRRSRASSTASFKYFQQPDDRQAWQDTEAIEDDSDEEQRVDAGSDIDLEYGLLSPSRRQSSSLSRSSTEDPLLKRRSSSATIGSMHGRGARVSQKMYILTEDLTIVIAGFRTSSIGFAVYVLLCICTLGLGYLLLRWLPHWRVKLVGSPCPLHECTWVVAEVRIDDLAMNESEADCLSEPMGRIHRARHSAPTVRQSFIHCVWL